MSHPALWPKTYFYPIGNTSAVCLTQDLPPEEPANVLLLGCGDPRNILYTIHAGNQASGELRQLDFTCCDYEPGVLARNVILLTLVVDGSSLDTIWNIFFHFKLDVDSMSLLISQSKRLIEISRDLETWNSSPYSGFIRMCNRDTLARLRQYWTLYVNFNDLPNSKIEFILRQFSSVNDTKSFNNISSARSAGLYFIHAVSLVSAHFSHYWRTGTVFRDHKIIAATIKLNPTFVYSVIGEGCAVHYGTHPLQCFHLGEAFASSHKGEVQECDLVNIAVSQFHRWCTSFKSAISTGVVRVRLFAGDAIAFCHALHHIRITSSAESGLYTSAWSGSLLALDSDDYTTRSAPTTFNIVETSNIIDHIGLLNLLIAAVPLLQHSPSTSLYTEALLPHGEKADTGFLARFCTDVPAMALLLGICPAGCVSIFSSQSNIHEILAQRFLKSQQYHERIAWKIPYFSNGDAFPMLKNCSLHPSFDPRTLARLLFDIYYNMFKDWEDFTHIGQKTSSMVRNTSLDSTGVQNSASLTLDGIIHYHRATFASLLGVVKSRVYVDWNATMEHLFDLLHSDKKLLLGSNYYQELCCQLHIRGIYSVDTLRPNSDFVTTRISRADFFREWNIVPPVVCVVLLVPRAKLKIFEDKGFRTCGSPMFQGEILGFPLFHSIFASIQVTFGSICTEGSGSDTKVIINEDPSGLCGKSPLVVSFWVPAFNLVMVESSSIKVGLAINSTSASTMAFRQELGLQLQVFTANLMDKKYVHVVSTRPHHSEELDILRAVSPKPPPSNMRPVSITGNSGNLLEMKVTWDLTPGQGRDALSKRTTEVNSKQVAPCAITINVGNAAENTLVFPFPVIGEKIKLRVARTSGYIEAVGPTRWPLVGMGPDFAARAPTMFLGEGNAHLLWNIHRVDLQHLPVMQKLDKKENSDLVNPHVSLAFSDRELALRKSDTESDVLVNVKGTLHALFNLVFQPNARTVFGLNDPSDGIYTIIVLNGIRLDASSHTLVADGCVLPLTEALVDRHLQKISSLTANGQMVRMTTRGSEVTAWKYLLPALTERCRSGWSHKKTCEYIISGVPRGTSCADNPICSCGEGKNLGKLGEKKEWSGLSKFMTRIAISPLFAISYLTSVAGEDRVPAHEAKPGRVKELQVCALASCKKPGTLTCSRCKSTKYCSAECQRAHWKLHKMVCKA